MTRILVVYRPLLPGQRAQAIQVVHMAHALARRGAQVTLLADRSGTHATPEAALAELGLAPHPGLHLRLAPVQHRGGAGMWFRGCAMQWCLRGPGTLYARDLRRLVGLRPVLSSHHRVVVEVHGLESQQRAAAPRVASLERQALALASEVIANCEGTAEAWQHAHSTHLPGPIRVAHNGTAPHRVRQAGPTDGVVRVVGSLRAFKGWSTLLDACAAGLPAPVEVVGGRASELGTNLPDGIRVHPPLPFAQVPDLLARSAALYLPLADNDFGRRLTSPLKLFDYLATAVPLILPDLPTVRRALASAAAPSDGIHWYRPGEPRSVHTATAAALHGGGRTPTLRSWDDRLDGIAAALGLSAR